MGADTGNGKANEDLGSGPASIVALAAALISGIGALTLTGVLGRVQRNHGPELASAIGFTVAGATMWLAASLSPHGKDESDRKQRINLWASRGLKYLGLVLVLIGVVLGFGTAVNTANDSERPTVTLKWNEKTSTVTGTATAANLSSAERLAVFIDGLVGRGAQYVSTTSLSRAFVGPDSDGKATNSLEVTIPPGRYDSVSVSASTDERTAACEGGMSADPAEQDAEPDVKEDRGTGCILLPLPNRPARPRLTASWGKARPFGRIVKLRLAIANTVGAPRRLVALQVVGLNETGKVPLYRATIAPHSSGTVHRRVRLPIDSALRRICAQATLLKSGRSLRRVTCPLHKAYADIAAADLRVPQR